MEKFGLLLRESVLSDLLGSLEVLGHNILSVFTCAGTPLRLQGLDGLHSTFLVLHQVDALFESGGLSYFE